MPLSVAQRLIFIRQVLENTLEEEEINNDRESASR